MRNSSHGLDLAGYNALRYTDEGRMVLTPTTLAVTCAVKRSSMRTRRSSINVGLLRILPLNDNEVASYIFSPLLGNLQRRHRIDSRSPRRAAEDAVYKTLIPYCLQNPTRQTIAQSHPSSYHLPSTQSLKPTKMQAYRVC